MVLEVDEAVDIYRECALYPSVVRGRICNAQAPGHVRAYTCWSQRDLEKGETTKFGRGHILQLDLAFPTPPSNIGTEQWNVESPSGKLCAVIRKQTNKNGDDKQFIEIWNDTHMLQCIDVESLEVHGKIYEDATFGCLEWSHSETHLLYIAEEKLPTAKSYFDRKALKDLEEGKPGIALGEEHVYHEPWGEQMSGKVHPVLCVLDIEAGAVSVLENIPDDISPGQAVWAPDDLGIICVGWNHEPYHLGIVYCPMRRSRLYYIDLKTYQCTTLGDTDQSVRSPIFSPDHKKLIYLQNPVGGPHYRCSELKMIDWSTKGAVTVVDIVHKVKDADTFPGLYIERLPRRCMSSDSKRLITCTQWRSRKVLVVIDCETGEVTRMTNDSEFGSWQFLDINNDLILAARSSPNHPQHLVIGTLPEPGQEASILWTCLDEEVVPLTGVQWEIMSLQPKVPNQQYAGLDYECILIQPTETSKEKHPLIVFPHGGPHSVFSAEFALYYICLVKCGFSILLINYRGSLGFGQDNIDSLLGHVGDQDVKDCQAAVERAIELGHADPKRILVMGGSHGGFLTCHLIGQYPDFYKAAVARNPVVNMASMFGATDIPDWTYTEIGLDFNFKSTPDAEIYAKLYDMSPIRYIDQMKTPIMLCIGAKDARVPPKQAHELRKALQARGVDVRTLCYAECEHPISEVKSEADCFVNIIKWFSQHLPITATS